MILRKRHTPSKPSRRFAWGLRVDDKPPVYYRSYADALAVVRFDVYGPTDERAYERDFSIRHLPATSPRRLRPEGSDEPRRTRRTGRASQRASAGRRSRR